MFEWWLSLAAAAAAVMSVRKIVIVGALMGVGHEEAVLGAVEEDVHGKMSALGEDDVEMCGPGRPVVFR